LSDCLPIFKALGDRNRLRILKMLEVKPLCVCEIKEVLGLAASTTSKHLSILKETRLVFEQKEGKWVNYHLNRASQIGCIRDILPLVQTWLDDDALCARDREKVQTVDRNAICAEQGM